MEREIASREVLDKQIQELREEIAAMVNGELDAGDVEAAKERCRKREEERLESL